MPVEDETLVSQMLRVTEANGLPSVGQLYRRIRKPNGPPFALLLHGPPDAWIGSAEETTGIDAAHLLAGTRRGGRYPSLRTWRPVPDQRITVHCPACLRDDGAWRLSWLLPYAKVCRIHDLILVDHRRSCYDRRLLHARWMNTAGSTRICVSERCRFPWGGPRAEPATGGDCDEHDSLLRLDTAGLLRVTETPSTADGGDRDSPSVLDTIKIRPRHQYDPPGYLEFLDRPL